MKRFLIKALMSITVFSFFGFGGVSSNLGFNTVIVKAEQSIVSKLGNPTVYYTPKGKSFHLDSNCSRLSKSKTIYSDKLSNVISSKSDPCDFCVKYTYSETSKSSRRSKSSNGEKKENIKLNVNKEELNKYLQNAYKKAFQRDIDGEGLNYWINELSGGKVTTKNFILNLIGSDEFDKLNLEADEKIKRAYGIMFGREADSEGLSYWKNQLNNNLKNNDSKQAIVLTVNEMMKSDELKQISNKMGVLY